MATYDVKERLLNNRTNTWIPPVTPPPIVPTPTATTNETRAQELVRSLAASGGGSFGTVAPVYSPAITKDKYTSTKVVYTPPAEAYDNKQKPDYLTETSGGSSGGGSYSAASAPAYDEIGALDAQRAQEEAMLNEYYAQQKALQEQLKNERLSLIENSQNELIAGANEAYNALAGARKSGYDYAGNAMNAQSDEALRQAYISKNMSERNLDQALSASGRSGGASETTRLGLAGAYANERGSTERQRAAALAKLLNELNQGQAEDTAWKTNLENQYRSQYVQGRDDVLSDTANAVSNYEAEALKTKLEAQRDYNARLAEAQQRAQAAALLAQRTR